MQHICHMHSLSHIGNQQFAFWTLLSCTTIIYNTRHLLNFDSCMLLSLMYTYALNEGDTDFYKERFEKYNVVWLIFVTSWSFPLQIHANPSQTVKTHTDFLKATSCWTFLRNNTQVICKDNITISRQKQSNNVAKAPFVYTLLLVTVKCHSSHVQGKPGIRKARLFSRVNSCFQGYTVRITIYT